MIQILQTLMSESSEQFIFRWHFHGSRKIGMYLRILRKPQIKKNSVLCCRHSVIVSMRWDRDLAARTTKSWQETFCTLSRESEHAINHYMSNLKIHKVRTHMPSVPGDLLFLVENFQIQCWLVDFIIQRVKIYFSRT